MNRKLLFQVTLPAIVIGTILVGVCLLSGWSLHRLQSNFSNVLSQNVTSLEAAQELEIRVRQLRYHSFLNMIDPRPDRQEAIETHHRRFEESLDIARKSANLPSEEQLIAAIEKGYDRYHTELARMGNEPLKDISKENLGQVADKHPIRPVVDACQELLKTNKEAIVETAQESDRLTGQAMIAMVILGLLGPCGGLIIGFGVARGMSRSIYQLRVRVQDMARHLDHNVGTVSVAADGDLQGLDDQLQQVVSRVEEVTDRLQQHQRELLRAEQLSAVGQLAASVAHEVRNPLTAMKMLVEAAMRPSNTKPLTSQDLKIIHTEIVRLERRVQEFLDFARLPTPRRATHDLRQILAESVGLIHARARQQGVEVVVSSSDDPVLGFVDKEQINTVLVNLLLNALDAMPHGGRLMAELNAVEQGSASVRIVDTGHGISPEMLPKLFTPFASSKATGTGLGLSISRRIVEEHQGTIHADNLPEGGACFAIRLPLSKAIVAHSVEAMATGKCEVNS